MGSWEVLRRLKSLESALIARAYAVVIIPGFMVGLWLLPKLFWRYYANHAPFFSGLGLTIALCTPVVFIMRLIVSLVELRRLRHYFSKSGILLWVFMHAQELLREQAGHAWFPWGRRAASANAGLLLERFVQKFNRYRASFEGRRTGPGWLGWAVIGFSALVLAYPMLIDVLAFIPWRVQALLADFYGGAILALVLALLLFGILLGAYNNLKLACVARILVEELSPTEELRLWAEWSGGGGSAAADSAADTSDSQVTGELMAVDRQTTMSHRQVAGAGRASIDAG